MTIKFKIWMGILIAFAMNLSLVSAVANFQVTGFSCSPSETVINNIFSCTAQIRNAGDAAGAVSVATLYSDSNGWLESSSYPQTSGTSVSPGQNVEITFTSLRAIKSGNNGFSKIMLDSVTDNYVSDNNKKVNVIDVIVVVSNSASSAAMGGNITSTSEVTAGGEVDVVLTFSATSGGCNVGSQTNPKTISGMSDGGKQSRTWTITQGTSGSCVYSMSAAATGVGGVASKIDTTSSTITCTDCPVPTTGSPGSSGSSGGSSGGAGGSTEIVPDILTKSIMKELDLNSGFRFTFGSVNHTFKLTNVSETAAAFTIESERREFILKIGEEEIIDLENDGRNDISVILTSVNATAKTALFVITPLYIPNSGSSGGSSGGSGEGKTGTESSKTGSENGKSPGEWNIWVIILISAIIVIGIAIGWVYAAKKYKQTMLVRSVKVRESDKK